MTPTATLRRLPLVGILGIALALVATTTPFAPAVADTAPSATITLRPHCAAGTTPCPAFETVDADTLRTAPLKKDDSLHMDLVIRNPAKRKIGRVRAWIQYNSVVMEGAGVSASELLPTNAPGELAFAPGEGLVKIDVSAVAGAEPAGETIEVARLLFKIKSVPQLTNYDVLSFYDVQSTPSGHTRIVSKKENGDDEDILTLLPGSLRVIFDSTQTSSGSSVSQGGGSSSVAQSGSGASSNISSATPSQTSSGAGHLAAGSGSTQSSASSASTVPLSSSTASTAAEPICGNGMLEAGEGCDDGNFLAGDGCAVNCRTEESSGSGSGLATASSVSSTSAMVRPDGMTCGSHADCKSGLCSGGVCRGDIIKVEDTGACTASTQCLSGTCTSNRCGVAAASAASLPPTTTAFTQLQVRNIRITTEGTSIFVAWDPLISSQLKAYNLYYGTTTGRYIQRKTVSPESTSMAIRTLPDKTTYFVAIRALSKTDEESAFSQEVSVEVGNPKTSTAPLTGDLLKTKNPVAISGETGVSSIFALLLILSAVTGTILASRRQMIALAAPPRP